MLDLAPERPEARPSRAPEAPPLLVRALRGEPVEAAAGLVHAPGRPLAARVPRAARGRSLLELATTPELAAEVTLQPVRRHGVDAAILFADIVVPLAAVGVDVEIQPGVGPVIGTPSAPPPTSAAAPARARRRPARARRGGPAASRASSTCR